MINCGNLRLMVRGPKEDVHLFVEELKRVSNGTLSDREIPCRRGTGLYTDQPVDTDRPAYAECSVYADVCERIWLEDLKARFPEVKLCAILRNDTNYAEIYSKSGSSRVSMTDRRVAYRKNISFPVYSWWDKDDPYDFTENPDGTLNLVKYYRWDRKLNVPEKMFGRTVTSIADEAFADNTEIRRITIPKSVKHIGQNAFHNCPNLVVYTESSDLRENLQRAGVMAVNQLSDMDQAQIQMHFSYEMTEGKIRILSYDGTDSYVVVPERIEDCPVVEIGAEAFCQKEAHKQSRRLKQVVLPDSVQKIGRKAFYDTDLSDFHLPERLETIGEYAFAYCRGPAKIRIPKNLTSIEELRDLYRIEEVEVDEENPCFCAREGVLFSKDACELIWYPTGKKRISYEIAPGVKRIADRAFEINKRLHDAGNLKYISMSDDVTQIGEKAFCNCMNLEQVTLSANITAIGMSAFFNCGSLQEIHIPEGVKEIAYGLFYMCRQLKNITIPNEIRKIDDRAFYGCRNLTKINLPKQLEQLGEYAFHDCQFLERLDIPPAVISIGREVCSQCQNLRTVTLAEGVRKIGRHAFFGCRNLRELAVPASVTAYAEWTEENCVLKLYGIPLREVTGKRHKQQAAVGYIQLKQQGGGLQLCYERGYEDYIRENGRDFYELAFADGEILHFLTDHDMIPEADLDDLLEKANTGKNTAMAASLLEYRNRLNQKSKSSAWDDILSETGWF